MVKKTKGLDVRKREQMKEFMDMFNRHQTIIVLVHADYCGHCQTYKERVWNNLSSGRNGTAAIHYDQLEGTPLENAKIKGYPSVLLVRKRAAQTPEEPEPLELEEFEDEENPGQTTNAMPMEKANDPKVMNTLINATKPASLVAKGSTGILESTIDDVVKSIESKSEETTPEEDAEEEIAQKTTLQLDKESEERLLNKSKNLNNSRKQNRFGPIPDPSKDILDTQKESENSSLPFSNEEGRMPSQKGMAVGGSLYSSLLAATRVEEPKRRKTRRGGSRGNRKRTKRRNRKTA